MQIQPDAEMTDFQLPPKQDPKEPVSVRMPTSLKAKIQWVVELWREAARAQGADKATVEAIDFPYVLLRLLAGRVDAELDGFKGFPDTEEKRKAALKLARDTAQSLKKSSK